jgi:hypothetical protein
MNSLKQVYRILLILLVAGLLVVPATAQGPVETGGDFQIALSFHNGFGISPPSSPRDPQIIPSGGRATTEIMMTDIEDMYAVNLAFDYNSDVVKVGSKINIEAGSLFAHLTENADYVIQVYPDRAFLRDPGSEPRFYPGTDRRTYVSVFIIDPYLLPIRGNGSLVKIHWQGQIDPADGPLALTVAEVTDEYGNKIEPCIGRFPPCINWPDFPYPAPDPPTLPYHFPLVGHLEIGAPAIGYELQVALEGGKAITDPTDDDFPEVEVKATGAFGDDEGTPILPDRVQMNFPPPYYSLTVSRPGYLSARADNVDETNVLLRVTLPAGDANQDDVIDIFDISTVASVLNSPAPVTSTRERLDYNGDGSITIADLALVARNYGKYGPILIPDP